MSITNAFKLSILLFFVIFLSSVFFVFFCKKRRWRKGGLILFSIGIWIILGLMLYPLMVEYNFTSEKKVSLISVGLMVLQMGVLNTDFSPWLIVAGNSFIEYKVVFTVLCYLAPLMTGGVFITLVPSILDIVKYFFACFLGIYKKELFYFSQLNLQSLILADSIRKKIGNNVLLIFCNVQKNENPLFAECRERNYICFSDSENELILHKRKKVTYFEISENSDDNLSHALQIIDTYKGKFGKKVSKLHNVQIYVYTEEKEASVIHSKIECKNIPVVLINRNRTIAYNLLYDNPLYNVLNKNQTELNVLVFSAGKIGAEIIKASLWCGQLGEDYRLSITAIDREAEYCKSKLKKECPSLFNGEYDLKFFECDVNTYRLEEILLDHCMHSNYIVVAMDNDELNLQTALYLRSFFLRQDKNVSNIPLISVLVQNDQKYEIMSRMKEEYRFVPFGNRSNIYSYDSVFNMDLQNIAININNSYMSEDDRKKMSPTEKKTLFFSNDANRRSSLAGALHYRYKLFTLGYVFADSDDMSYEEYNDVIKSILSLQDDAPLRLKYQKIEHQRWNAYERSEGLVDTTLEQVKAFISKTGNHKFPMANLHGCICSWDELDLLGDFFNKDFKNPDDRLFIENMLNILGMTEDISINSTGIRKRLRRNI